MRSSPSSNIIDAKQSVQEVPYQVLRKQLLQDGQILEYATPVGVSSSQPENQGVPLKSLPGIVIDDEHAQFTGEWIKSHSTSRYVGPGYHHDGDKHDGSCTARFEAKLPRTGTYEVRMSYSPHPNRATNVPVTLTHSQGMATATINQREVAPIDELFISLGQFPFDADQAGVVEISNTDTNGHVIVDTVQWLEVK